MEFSELIKIHKIPDRVRLVRPGHQPLEGALCVTGHHLILYSESGHGTEELWIQHSKIDCTERTNSGYTLLLKCKDFQIIELTVPSSEDCSKLAWSIDQLSNIDNKTLAYPFFYRPKFDILDDGWQAFRLEMEFTNLLGSSDEWRLSYVNKNFEVCKSYPTCVIVPKSVDDDLIRASAAFRQHGRFPVFSYQHRNNRSVILRSGQPLIGSNTKRCKEDEKLLGAFLNNKRGYILDTRSPTIAKLAMNKGGGVEPDHNYSQWKRIHQPIERPQVFHESLVKLVEACTDTNSSMDKWLSRLDSCNWLGHVKDILTCACVAAQCIDKEGMSVLIHGTEGLDTTLQVSAISQLILDHDCRTVHGFQALVQREWLQSGHQFSLRCAKSAYAMSKNKYESPVFLLFLDCVWQIWQQFPCSFEFNEQFLIMLFEHAYSSQFGTFMCNNDMERQSYKLHEKTVSLWSYLSRPEVLQQYLNALYEPNPTVIWPSVAPQSLSLWPGLYLRWQIDLSTQQEAWEEITRIKETDKELKLKANRCRRQIDALEREAVSTDVLQPSAPQYRDFEYED